jgi:hypothetical protein
MEVTMSSLRSVLQDFVRWTWIIHLLIVFFMVFTWRFGDWFMALPDPSATQAGVLLGLIGALPSLGAIYAIAIARIPPPT